MEKTLRIMGILALLSAFSTGCGDGGGNQDAGTDASEEDASTEDAGDAGPTCVQDPTTLQGQATFETNLRFLNQCTQSQFRDFDNATRIQHPQYVPGGPYPALP